jgi:hypothetical protein
MADQQTTTSSDVQGLIATLDDYFVKRAPFQLPEPAKELIVKFGPWISLVLLVLLLPLLLLALGIGAVFSPFAGPGAAAGFGIAAIFVIVQIALLAMALPGLFNRRMSGWTLMFYEQLVSFVYSLLTGSYIGGILGLIIGLYFLFQVRAKYH